jgi:hypothetical protein
MEAAKPLDKEINQYLRQLSVQQKEVVLSVIKTFAREEAWWDNKAYMHEMDKRFEELENGTVKAYTLEEMEAGAREAYKKRKRKK